MPKVSVRYIVDDVDAAIDFYCRHLGFHEDMHPAPALAMLSCGDLRLALSAPGGPAPQGRRPLPQRHRRWRRR
jgi:catechol 2,3-dioxygenase-like lactoylglutathione lyase family enzyme